MENVGLGTCSSLRLAQTYVIFRNEIITSNPNIQGTILYFTNNIRWALKPELNLGKVLDATHVLARVAQVHFEAAAIQQLNRSLVDLAFRGNRESNRVTSLRIRTQARSFIA